MSASVAHPGVFRWYYNLMKETFGDAPKVVRVIEDAVAGAGIFAPKPAAINFSQAASFHFSARLASAAKLNTPKSRMIVAAPAADASFKAREAFKASKAKASKRRAAEQAKAAMQARATVSLKAEPKFAAALAKAARLNAAAEASAARKVEVKPSRTLQAMKSSILVSDRPAKASDAAVRAPAPAVSKGETATSAQVPH